MSINGCQVSVAAGRLSLTIHIRQSLTTDDLQKEGKVKTIQFISILFLILGMSVLISRSTAHAEENPDVSSLVKGNTQFAFDLYGELKEKKGNLFFSPYSISTALAMTFAGARGNTEKQMADTLHFTALGQERVHPAYASLETHLNGIQKRGGIRLNVANALWPHKDAKFVPKFLDRIKTNYHLSIKEDHILDYEKNTKGARKTINQWVEKETNQKITELIKPGILDTLTRLVLTNAIYFKGDWASQFDNRLTKDAPFTLSSGKTVETPMMYQKGKFWHGEADGLQVLELPYVGDDLSMIILLPEKKDGLSDLQERLTLENTEKWLENLQNREVEVFLPTFKLTSQFRLDESLASMGMPDAFHEKKADFSGMDGQKDGLFIAAVLHKAYVDVNEEGTEAAAATAVVMQTRGMVMRTIFRADHPFLFLIRDKNSQTILFFGRVENPKL